MKLNVFFIILGAIVAMCIYSAFAQSNREICTVNTNFNRMECCTNCNTIGATVDIYNL